MANTPKSSPLGINVIGEFVKNSGLTINPVAQRIMGQSKRNATYQPGTCVSQTCLNLLTYAINDAYNRNQVAKSPAGTSTYDNLISIGSDTIPALGNARPPSYVPTDPANLWARPTPTSTTPSLAEQRAAQAGFTNSLPGPATTGYGNFDGTYGDDLQGAGITDQKQNATWYPYDMTNPNHSITQWGWIRCHALQAWNEFNWNGLVVDPDYPGLPSYLQSYTMPEYKEFTSSLSFGNGYVNSNNESIIANHNAKTFLDGTYSNMDDLITADIAGVNLATFDFGTDLENLGDAIDLSKIDRFGLPSVLLQTIASHNAVITDLAVLLLATGITTTRLNEIMDDSVTPTEEEERNILSTFRLITDENLHTILASLRVSCTSTNFRTLADLLDVRRLFPTSFSSLTVPMYNSGKGQPTNSKTYYPLYLDGGLNPALDSPAMREYVGRLVPAGTPPIYESSTTSSNYQCVDNGFDSYLSTILPKEQAIAAGAFSFTMRQISQIEGMDIRKFAKVAKSLETTTDLPLVAGTSNPTNQSALQDAENLSALGSGIYGTYTMSDLFGSMTGLPYPWKLIQKRITELQTDRLQTIYRELYLATTWEQAVLTPVLDGSDNLIAVTITNPGGGYGRGGASVPTIVASNGATLAVTLGTNPADVGANGNGTFGRVVNVQVLTSGTPDPSVTLTIQAPPTATLAASSTTGTNTASGTPGWPTMNAALQSYIDEANTEIAAIQQSNTLTSRLLNAYWDILGKMLVIEQRTRFKALAPAPIPKDLLDADPTSSIVGFVDDLRELARDTMPHMSAQTLEAIADMTTLGGQSLIAIMRQERNEERLQQLGIGQVNSSSDQIDTETMKTLLANGTAPGARTGIEACGQTYTIPAWLSNTNETDVSPSPGGFYRPITEPINPGFNTTDRIADGDIQSILNCSAYPTTGTLVPTNPEIQNQPDCPPIIGVPTELDPNNLPPNLDTRLTRSSLLPSVLDPDNALRQVIECNCSCWID